MSSKPRYIDVNQLSFHFNNIYDQLECLNRFMYCCAQPSMPNVSTQPIIVMNSGEPVVHNMNADASLTDVNGIVFLNAALNSVTYTIDPVALARKVIKVYALSAAFAAMVKTKTGVIKLPFGDDVTEVQLVERESKTFYSDGINLLLL